MIWFRGVDTAGIERYINLERVQNIRFGPNDMGNTVATVVTDRQTFYFRDPDTLDRLKAALEPPMTSDMVPDRPFVGSAHYYDEGYGRKEVSSAG